MKLQKIAQQCACLFYLKGIPPSLSVGWLRIRLKLLFLYQPFLSTWLGFFF